VPKKIDDVKKPLEVKISGSNLASLIEPFLKQLKVLTSKQELVHIQNEYSLFFNVRTEKTVPYVKKTDIGPPDASEVIKKDLEYIKSKEIKYVEYGTQLSKGNDLRGQQDPSKKKGSTKQS
jgi:hypothetical protein